HGEVAVGIVAVAVVDDPQELEGNVAEDLDLGLQQLPEILGRPPAREGLEMDCGQRFRISGARHDDAAEQQEHHDAQNSIHCDLLLWQYRSVRCVKKRPRTPKSAPPRCRSSSSRSAPCTRRWRGRSAPRSGRRYKAGPWPSACW